MVRYLLGDLSEPDRERVEQDYFVNDDAHDRLNEAENDLIDSYVRGSLSQRQRAQFESYFLDSPTKRKRVEFAKVLIEAAQQRRGQAPEPVRPEAQSASRGFVWPWSWHPQIRLAWSMAILAVLVAVASITVEDHNLRTRMAALRADRDTLQHRLEKLPGQTSASPAEPGAQERRDIAVTGTAKLAPPQIPLVAMLLESGAERGGVASAQNWVLALPSSPSLLVLSLDLERDDFPAYDVVLQTAEGKVIQRIGGVRSCLLPNGGRSVPVVLSSQLLRAEDYVVRLLGRNIEGKPQSVDAYTFRATR
ncbi:MAG: hypothetical protein ABSG25_08610 [Bryobacteraceae bacterium]